MDPSLAILGGALLAGVAVAAWLRGWSGVESGILAGGQLLKTVGLQMLLGFLLAGFVQVVVPSQVISTWMGEGSGLRGVLVGTLAGILAPAGPYVQFPLLASLRASGAGLGPIAAYLTAWSVIPLMRTVVWELPLLGTPFTAARFAFSFPLPVIVGLAVAWLVGLVPRISFLR
ncbi:MAG: permease [Chloroflexi bacterium]|nr:permease [Chloroflexota bacterium]